MQQQMPPKMPVQKQGSSSWVIVVIVICAGFVIVFGCGAVLLSWFLWSSDIQQPQDNEPAPIVEYETTRTGKPYDAAFFVDCTLAFRPKLLNDCWTRDSEAIASCDTRKAAAITAAALKIC